VTNHHHHRFINTQQTRAASEVDFLKNYYKKTVTLAGWQKVFDAKTKRNINEKNKERLNKKN